MSKAAARLSTLLRSVILIRPLMANPLAHP
jgi:hypothetical protein